MLPPPYGGVDLSLLQAAGFTQSEIAVYLALLDLGESTTGPIVERSGTASSKVYEVLEKLSQKGMVSSIIREGTKRYQAAEPERLLDYFTEKEATLRSQREAVRTLLPELRLRQNLAKPARAAAIYEGLKGLETAFTEALAHMKPGEIYYAMGVPKRSDAANRFFLRFNRTRVQKNIRMRILFDESARGDEQAELGNNELSEVRFTGGIRTPAAANIFSDRVIIFPEEVNDEQLLIVLYGSAIAASFRAQFEAQWNMQTRVYTGPIGPKMVFEGIQRASGELLAYGLHPREVEQVLSEEMKNLISLEIAGNTPVRLIYTEPPPASIVGPTSTVKVLASQHTGPLHVEIYGDTAAIIDWAPPISTMIIERADIAAAYRRHFEILWKLPQAKLWVRP